MGNETGYVFRDRYPEREMVYRRFDEESARARRVLECLLDVPFGSGERETFDLFPSGRDAPLLIFVHGGYWQSLSKDRFAFVASRLVPEGVSVAFPNYPLAPQRPLEAIVASVQRSAMEILKRANLIGTAPPFWMVCGHSAGGHLAAMLALTDWQQKGITLPLAGCIPISGVFDLEPLIETSLNKALRLDTEKAAVLSPLKRATYCGRLLAFVGAEETSAFLTQSENYIKHWRGLGGPGDLVRLENKNHYTVLCDLFGERSEIAGGILSFAKDFAGGQADGLSS